MTGREFIDEYIDEFGDPDVEIPVMNDFDDAIIGLMIRFGQEYPVVAYNRRKVIQILMSQGMTRDEAQEFNQVGLYADNVWCFIDTPDPEEVT